MVEVTNEFVDEMLVLLEENGIEYEIFDGSLNDNYIVYDVEKAIKITGVRRAKFYIIKEVYLNSWSSGMVLIATDDREKAEKYRQQFEGAENNNEETSE